jgi:hypothetical protein
MSNSTNADDELRKLIESANAMLELSEELVTQSKEIFSRTTKIVESIQQDAGSPLKHSIRTANTRLSRR